MYIIHSKYYSILFTLIIEFIAIFDYQFNIQIFAFIPITINAPAKQ